MIKIKERTESHRTKYKSYSVAFFPISQLTGNPYWTLLAEALQECGVTFNSDTPDSFDWKWLLKKRKQINILHLHYIHQFYSTHIGHTRFLSVLRFALYMLLARVLMYRVVFTLHNLEPTYWLQPAWLDDLGHRITISLSESVIVHSQAARRLLLERYGRSRHVFLADHPNFIDYYPNTISKEDARKMLNLPQDSIVFTFFGGVRPNKGIETLIWAFQHLEDERLRLVIAGKIFRPKTYAQSLQEMANGDARVSFFLEYISDEQVQLFMNAADIVVLPFAKILTSSSTVLAMSFARPVIVPRMGGLPELVEPDSGWIFEPGNIDSLTGAMIAAAECNFSQKGQAALKKISQYTSKQFAEQTILAYLR